MSSEPGKNPQDDDLRRALRAGAALVWILVVITFLANAPGRHAIALREAGFGRPEWQFLVGGFVGDLAGVMPLLAVVLVAHFALELLVARLRKRPPAPLTAARAWIVAGVFGVASIAAWLTSVGASEFKLERGNYPTLYETKLGMTDPTFVTGELPTLTMDRYRAGNIVFLIGLAVCLVFLVRSLRRPEATPSTSVLKGFAASTLGVWLLSGVVLLGTTTFFPAIDHRRVLYPPVVTLFKGMLAQGKTSVFRGLRGVLVNAKLPDEKAKKGARLLGYSAAQGEAILPEAPIDCAKHPLARPIPGLESEAEGTAQRTPLVAALVDLSKALFAGRTTNLTLWHVAIESYRGDDVFALNPASAPEVTPFTSSVYDAAAKPGARAIAFPHAFQGGMRTSQAISGLMCGLGAMPFNLALSRDLGYVPLRCLPDVLSDAGFSTRATYASDLSFDNMLEFFRYHGAATTQNVDFPKGLPKGTWDGVTDLPVYEYTLKRALADEGSQYHFILTLAGHTPFERPEDLPKDVEERMTKGAKAKLPNLGEDDRKRLATMAYADWAMDSFVKELEASPEGARSLLVVSADHSTGDPFVWSSGDTLRSESQIPFYMYVPEAFAKGAQDPEAVRAKIDAVNALAATTPISANDVPTLLLALLSASHELASLPQEWRWATLGGMATSPTFELDGVPSARTWGIAASARLFSVPNDPPIPVGTNETCELFNDPVQMRRLGPTLGAAAAFTSDFMKGYGSKCSGAEHIRKGAKK